MFSRDFARGPTWPVHPTFDLVSNLHRKIPFMFRVPWIFLRGVITVFLHCVTYTHGVNLIKYLTEIWIPSEINPPSKRKVSLSGIYFITNYTQNTYVYQHKRIISTLWKKQKQISQRYYIEAYKNIFYLYDCITLEREPKSIQYTGL